MQFLYSWLESAFLNLGLSPRFADSLAFFFSDLVFLCFVLIIGITFFTYVRKKFLENHLANKLDGKPKFIIYTVMALLGIVSPFCSCSAIPAFIALSALTIPTGALFVYLIVAPLVQETSMILLISQFGIPVTLVYIIQGVFAGVVTGLILARTPDELLFTDNVLSQRIRAQKERKANQDANSEYSCHNAQSEDHTASQAAMIIAGSNQLKTCACSAKKSTVVQDSKLHAKAKEPIINISDDIEKSQDRVEASFSLYNNVVVKQGQGLKLTGLKPTVVRCGCSATKIESEAGCCCSSHKEESKSNPSLNLSGFRPVNTQNSCGCSETKVESESSCYCSSHNKEEDKGSSCGCSSSKSQTKSSCGCGSSSFDNSKSANKGGCCCSSVPKSDSLLVTSFYEAYGILRKTFKYIVIGLAFGALIHGVIPQEWIETLLGVDNYIAPIYATLIGIPIYADDVALIPIAKSLLESGAALGTSLSFVMASAVVSLPSFVLLSSVLQKRIIIKLAFILTVIIMLIGYVFNILQPILM